MPLGPRSLQVVLALLPIQTVTQQLLGISRVNCAFELSPFAPSCSLQVVRIKGERPIVKCLGDVPLGPRGTVEPSRQKGKGARTLLQ